MNIDIYNIWTYMHIYKHMEVKVRRTFCCLNFSNHHVKSDTEQCCNNWRICCLDNLMEHWGLILDKIKFQTWGPIYVMDCWPLEGDLKNKKQVFVYCLPFIIVMDITDWSKHIQDKFWEQSIYILIHECVYNMDRYLFDRNNIKFHIQIISTNARRYTSNDPYCFVLQDHDMFRCVSYASPHTWIQ